jgi:hypothetical protein
MNTGKTAYITGQPIFLLLYDFSLVGMQRDEDTDGIQAEQAA